MALKSLKCIDIPHFIIIILHSNDYNNYYTLYSLSVFLWAKNLQLILEIGATYRLVIC